MKEKYMGVVGPSQTSKYLKEALSKMRCKELEETFREVGERIKTAEEEREYEMEKIKKEMKDKASEFTDNERYKDENLACGPDKKFKKQNKTYKSWEHHEFWRR